MAPAHVGPVEAQVIVTNGRETLRICLTCADKVPFKRGWKYLRWTPRAVAEQSRSEPTP